MHEFYEPEVLKRLQQTELSILKDFMELCDAHGLLYFGIGGTGIGALRHGGFIPWDDDIDIAMPRKDFERFLSLAKKEFAGKYYILNNKTNENYPMMTTRLCKCGTVFQERVMKDVDCPFGIFLDLYVMDNIADGKLAVQVQAWTPGSGANFWYFPAWNGLIWLRPDGRQRPSGRSAGWFTEQSGRCISGRQFSGPIVSLPAENMNGYPPNGWPFCRIPIRSGTWWTKPGCFRCRIFPMKMYSFPLPTILRR